MTRDEFKELIKTIKHRYPNMEFAPATKKEVFDDWFKLFQRPGITKSVMDRAVDKYTRENKYPPTYADLVQYGKEIYLADRDVEENKRWRNEL